MPGPDARGASCGAGAGGYPRRAVLDRPVPEGARSDIQKKSLRAAEQGRSDVAAAREAWREQQPRMNPAQLVFIDETWATTNMTRLRGRCQRGERLVAAVPHGHWKTS